MKLGILGSVDDVLGVVFQSCDVQVCAVMHTVMFWVLGCSSVLEMIPPILTVCVRVCASWDMFGLL
jgi:hypothetical protein